MKIILVLIIVFLAFGWWKSEKENAENEGRRPIWESVISESTKSELALRDPASMTPEERQLAAEWGNGAKRRYVARADAIGQTLAQRMEGGYDWERESERRARAAIRDLNAAIDRDDFLAAPGRLRAAEEAVRLFEAGCRWRAGMRHSTSPHIHSSALEGKWCPDYGWRFLREGSLEVGQTCHCCNGSGWETTWITCNGCNGEGTVMTTLSTITEVIDETTVIVHEFDDFLRTLKGKPARGRRERHGHRPQPTRTTCRMCNGRGEIQATQQCHVCGGHGWTR